MIQIVILGAGNVGRHLFNNFTQTKDVQVIQWFNRNLNSIESHKNEVRITNRIEELEEADVYLLCLSDDILAEISDKLNPLKGVIAHTAGSVSMNVLSDHENHGVFYPLQTFSKNRAITFENIPICIEGNNKQSEETLNKLAALISENIHAVNSKQRMGLHTAAVFLNNFVNHLYQVGSEICEEQKVPFEMLLPLIKETASKIESISPKDAQTGPALRKDKNTIHKHLDLLSNPAFKNLYLTLTDSIQKNDEHSKL